MKMSHQSCLNLQTHLFLWLHEAVAAQITLSGCLFVSPIIGNTIPLECFYGIPLNMEQMINRKEGGACLILAGGGEKS